MDRKNEIDWSADENQNWHKEFDKLSLIASRALSTPKPLTDKDVIDWSIDEPKTGISPAPTPSIPQSRLGQFGAGLKTGFTQLPRGIAQLLLEHTNPKAAAMMAADIKAQQAAEPDVWPYRTGKFVGELGSELPAMMVAPGTWPARMAAQGLIGAGIGAAQPQAEAGRRGAEAVAGGVSSLLVQGAGEAIAGIAAPRVAEGARKLFRSGVAMTPGQLLGGEAKRAEEMLRSIPGIGAPIVSAHRQVIEDFTRSTVNQALRPLGALPRESMRGMVPNVGTRIGHEAVDYAGKLLNEAYKNIIPKTGAVIDIPFVNAYQQVLHESRNLGKEEKRTFDNLMEKYLVRYMRRRQVDVARDIFEEGARQARRGMDISGGTQMIKPGSRLVNGKGEQIWPVGMDKPQKMPTPGIPPFGMHQWTPMLTGKEMQESISALKSAATDYIHAPDPAKREMGKSIFGVVDHLQDMMARQNPGYARQKKLVDASYAMYMRANAAASALGSKEGVFTPAQLKNKARAFDPSLRKMETGRGKALWQKYAAQSEKLIGNIYPDSGTAGRTLMTALLLGEAGMDPNHERAAAILGGTALAGGIYSRPFRMALARYMTAERPAVARRALEIIRRVSGPAGVAYLENMKKQSITPKSSVEPENQSR